MQCWHGGTTRMVCVMLQKQTGHSSAISSRATLQLHAQCVRLCCVRVAAANNYLLCKKTMRVPAWLRSVLLTTSIVLAVFALLQFIYGSFVPRQPSQKKHVHWAPTVVSYEHAQPQMLQPPAPPLRPRVWQPYPPSTYQTIGYLEGDGETRPLLGRRSHTRRHRWHYSSTNDPKSDINSLRLPVTSTVDNNRKCTEDMGCMELFDGDNVTVPGVAAPMKVHLYEKHFG